MAFLPSVSPYGKNYTITLASANNAIFTVDALTVTANSVGTANLSVMVSDGVNSATTVIPVNVVASLPFDITYHRQVDDIVLAHYPKFPLKVGEEFVCQAYALSPISDGRYTKYQYDDENIVSWASSNTDVATIKFGVLTAVGIGSSTITATSRGISTSFTLTVEAADPEIVYTDIDITGLSLSDIFNHGGNIRIPTTEFTLDPITESFAVTVPTNIDFNGSTVYSVSSDLTRGANLISIKASNSKYKGLTFIGEMSTPANMGAEGNTFVSIGGNVKRTFFENCVFKNSPGFCTSFGNTNRKVSPFKLNDVVDEGNGQYSCGYTRCDAIRGNGNQYAVGNVQGYGGYRYLSARVYDIEFYTEDYALIERQADRIQYYYYDIPPNAYWCKLFWCWNAAPVSSDPDYFAIAFIFSFDHPVLSGFVNCAFENNYSTGIAPNGGTDMIIKGCTFNTCGYRDPASSLDWEDGRQLNRGHILSYCTIEKGSASGTINVIGGDGVVMHNNIIDAQVNYGSEAQNGRFYLNVMDGGALSVSPKTDEVVAQNQFINGATVEINDVSDVNFKVRVSSNV